MIPDKILHSVEIYEKDEWESEDYPEVIDGYQHDERIYVPDVGGLVECGWHTRDGERVEELSEEEYYKYDPDSDVETGYERSPEYRVVDVKTHYHHSRIRKDSMNLMTNRIELTTEVIVVPRRENDDE